MELFVQVTLSAMIVGSLTGLLNIFFGKSE